METARQGFVTLLGSADKADATIARIKQEAARTPFEVAGLTQATQMLASVTKDGNRAINIILDVGEALAAMGRGQAELDRISVNLQQIAAVGKASMIDIKQFAFAGIPIFEMLQEETGLAGEALETFISDGKVSFDLLVGMFDKANNEGGRFFNAFKNQAGTFDQLWSNLKDTFSQTAAEIVVSTGLFDLLKQGMEAISKWVTDNKEGISNAFKAMFNGLAWVWTNLLVPIYNWFQTNWPMIWQVIQEGWAVIKPVWDEFVRVLREDLWPELKKLWDQLQPIMPFLGVILVAAVGSLVVGLLVLAKVINAVTYGFNLMVGAALWLANKTMQAADWISNAFNTVLFIINDVKNAIFGAANALDRLMGGKNQLSIGLSGRANIPGRAIGGSVTSGQPYVVGERGPELFVPSNNGKIVPNNKMGGGATININVGLMTGSAIERREAAQKMFEDLKVIASQQGQSVSQMIGSA